MKTLYQKYIPREDGNYSAIIEEMDTNPPTYRVTMEIFSHTRSFPLFQYATTELDIRMALKEAIVFLFPDKKS